MAAFLSQNPRTEEILASYPFLSGSELDAKVQEAKLAHKTWRKTKLEDRASILVKVGNKLKAQETHFAKLMENEMGKLYDEALSEVQKCAALCLYSAATYKEALTPNAVQIENATVRVQHESLGVILAIMPWNFPFWQFFRAAVPLLLSGNVLLLKHAFNTPQCALALESIFAESFATPIVQNIFIDHDQAQTLIAHPTVRGVTLTGSKRAGVAVASAAGSAVKPCVLELGGSDPFIVFDDSDLEKAAQTAVTSRCINNGQSCIAAKRFLVEAKVHDQFVAKMTDLMSKKVIGPLATRQQQLTVAGQVEDALQKGAKVHCGGGVKEQKGFFYPPTVLTNISGGMRVASEEVFGPVATIYPFASDDEAITIGNQNEYGLGATIFTRNAQRIERFTEELECGMVFVNDMVRSDQRFPFGGIKDSGFGRELGPNAARSFTNEKTVWIHQS